MLPMALILSDTTLAGLLRFAAHGMPASSVRTQQKVNRIAWKFWAK
jgi:hypothetical protein